MKKILALLLLVFSVCALLCACGDEPETVYYSVEFDSNGAERYTSRTIPAGGKIVEPKEPTRGGYDFDGWFYKGVKWDFEKDIVNSNIKLTAQWTRTIYLVTFDTGADGVTVSNQVIESGEKLTEPAEPTRDGYIFLGWYNGDELWNFESYPVVSEMKLTARWEEIILPTYKVSFNSAGGTSVASQTVIEGELAAAPESPTKAGCRFLGWYLGEELFDFTSPITSAITLDARWEEIPIPTHKVTFNSQGGSSIEAQYPVDGTAVADPGAPGYPSSENEIRDVKFLGWYLGENLYDFSTPVTKDITLSARWKIDIYYKITFLAEGDASYPQEKIVKKGDTVPLLRPAREGYRFVGWYFGNAVWRDNETPVSNITLTAKWEEIPTYTVTFDSNGGSAVSSAYVKEGGYVAEPGNPVRDEHRFIGWVDASGNRWDFNSMKVNSNITLKAEWEFIISYIVAFDSQGGTLVASQKVAEGTLATMPDENPTKVDHRFAGWYYGDVKWDFNTMTVNSQITLRAEWIEQVYAVFNDADGKRIKAVTLDKGTLLNQNTAPDAPEKENHRFIGWQAGDVLWDFATMTVDQTTELTPRYIRQYVVKFETGCDINIADQKVDDGGVIKRPDTPQRGQHFSFDGWFIKDSDVEWIFKGDGVMTVDGDITLVAHWSIMTPPDIFIKTLPGES